MKQPDKAFLVCLKKPWKLIQSGVELDFGDGSKIILVDYKLAADLQRFYPKKFRMVKSSALGLKISDKPLSEVTAQDVATKLLGRMTGKKRNAKLKEIAIALVKQSGVSSEVIASTIVELDPDGSIPAVIKTANSMSCLDLVLDGIRTRFLISELADRNFAVMPRESRESLLKELDSLRSEVAEIRTRSLKPKARKSNTPKPLLG